MKKIVLFLIILTANSFAQIGNVTGIKIENGNLILSSGSDKIVFAPATENTIMVNYRPNGIEDRDTLVIGPKNYQIVPASFDTTSDPIVITGEEYTIKIQKNPMRFFAYSKSGELLLNENLNSEITSAGRLLGRYRLQNSAGFRRSSFYCKDRQWRLHFEARNPDHC